MIVALILKTGYGEGLERNDQGGDREINKDIPSKFFLRPERRD